MAATSSVLFIPNPPCFATVPRANGDVQGGKEEVLSDPRQTRWCRGFVAVLDHRSGDAVGFAGRLGGCHDFAAMDFRATALRIPAPISLAVLVIEKEQLKIGRAS